MAKSSDGFELAERDLEIRGSGEVFGERQSGWTDLKLGRLPRDEPIVIQARAVAEAVLDADPGSGPPPAAARRGRGPSWRSGRVLVQGLKSRRSDVAQRKQGGGPSGRLRVVAGSVGGRRFEAPPGEAIRPTTERVREAVFSSLGSADHRGIGPRPLRGYWCDGDRGAVAWRGARGVGRPRPHGRDGVPRKTSSPSVSPTSAGWWNARSRRCWRRARRPEAPFDVVCCDPPYDTPDAEVVAIGRSPRSRRPVGWRRERAVVVERGVAQPRWRDPEWLATPVRAGLRGYARHSLCPTTDS